MSNSKSVQSQKMIDLAWHLTLIFAVGICVAMLPDMAVAGGGAGGGQNAIDAVFCNVVSLITGSTGKAIATVAVIAVGVGALLGKVSWAMALIVALGIALVFGAATIVNFIANGANGGNNLDCQTATNTITNR